MSSGWLNPTSTIANSGAVTGAGSAHAALSDGSDSSYVTFDPGELVSVHVDDLSLPAGAVVVYVRAGVKVMGGGSAGRLSVVAGSQSMTHQFFVNWLSPVTVEGATILGGLSDSDVDGATVGFVHAAGSGTIVAYQLALYVVWFTQPSVTVTAPTGTIDENVVTVSWSPSFDADADSEQHYREVKIYSSAQYGGGGFDPDSSVSTAESGVELGFFNSKVFSNAVLPDGTYRAYVRVASRDAPDHWSDWDYEQFVVDAPNPGVPSLALSGEDANGRIEIELDDTSGDVSTTHFQVQRADDGTNFVDVRTDLGDGLVATSGSLVTIYDYEAPNGTTVTYRARAFNDATPSYSAWTTGTEAWSSGAEWLKVMLDPSLNMSLVVRSYPGFEVPANQTAHRALGSDVAIVTSDVPGPEQGTVELFTKSEEDREDLAALLASGSPILLQVPGTPDRCVRFGDRASTRVVDMAREEWHGETFPWTVVDRP